MAIKDGNVVFYENKDRFVLSDFEKVHNLIANNLYSNSINRLLHSFSVSKIHYGIGMPFSEKNLTKSNQHVEKIDFVMFVKEDSTIELIDNYKIFNQLI